MVIVPRSSTTNAVFSCGYYSRLVTILSLMLFLAAPPTCLSFSAMPDKPPNVPQKRQRKRQRLQALPNSQVGRSAKKRAQPRPDDVLLVNEMPPFLPDPLKNHYYLLRHGQSTGNVEGVISSSRSLATSTKHGLTELGYEQGFGSVQQLLDCIQETIHSDGSTKQKDDNEDNGNTNQELLIYASPFARAKQTAQACLDGLAEPDQLARAKEIGVDICTEVHIDSGLMERYFGRLDDEAIHTYAYVWPVDRIDVTHTAFDVESVAAVATRVRSFVLKMEDQHDGKHLVLASHADVLQIMQLYAAGAKNVGSFSSYRFANGEVRTMKRTPDSLPVPEPLAPPKSGT